MIDFTTVVAVDEKHAEELRAVWPTWQRYRPSIFKQPLLLICDAKRTKRWWHGRLSFLDHPNIKWLKWNLPGTDQREKMLSSFVLLAPFHIETDWYLKLDTDVVAAESSDWLDSSWFAPNKQGQIPAFISSPWGYTKPANFLPRLSEWAENCGAFSHCDPLLFQPSNGDDVAHHPRITSWCFFGNTAWTRAMASLCDGRLPVPSHDTFLWYCAARRRDFYRRVRMQRSGWRHVTCSLNRLRAAAQMALESSPLTTTCITRPLARAEPACDPLHTQSLVKLIKGLNLKQVAGAEIGVASGDCSRVLLREIPSLHLYMIDSWAVVSGNHRYARSGDRCAILTGAEQNTRAEIAERETAFAKNRRTLLRLDSLRAANRFARDSLDFVFIDADHTYEGVQQDIAAWWSKVRCGGIVTGHDYKSPRDLRGIWGVSRAVDEFAQQMNLSLEVNPGGVWTLRKPQAAITISGARPSVTTTPVPSKCEQGIIYLLTRPTHAARLIVSLASLREHYQGPVTIYTTHAISGFVADLCVSDPLLRVEHRAIREVARNRNSTLLTKVALLPHVPYRQAVFLDADTLITGSITELFDSLNDAPIGITQFANWRTTHRKMRRRLNAWRRLQHVPTISNPLSTLIDNASTGQPAVNIGVFAFDSQAPFLNSWYELADAGRRTFICDEIALQLILPTIPHRLLDCRFNCSPVYARHQSDVRIWHFHGDKHVASPLARTLWLSKLIEYVRQDIAQIRSWIPLSDNRLNPFMRELPLTESAHFLPPPEVEAEE